MLEKGKISAVQFTLLVILFTIGSSVLIIPAGLAVEAKQDAWITAFLSVGIGLLLVWLYIILGNRFPYMSLAEYSERILGKWLGKTISCFFFSFTLLLTSLVLRNIGDFLTTQNMPSTPIQAVHIIFLMIVMMGTRLGIESIGRAAQIFFPWVVLFFLVMVISISPLIKLENIQPIFEAGAKAIIRAAVPFIGTPFMELVTFLMILPYVNQTKKGKKAFMVGTLIGGIVLIMDVLLCILVLGFDTTARQAYPSYVLVKKISIIHILERIEAVMAGIWFISVFFKTTICFYVSVLGMVQTFELKDYRFLIFPLGIIVMILSIVSYPNTAYMISFVSKIWTPYALTYGLFLPLLLIVVSFLRKEKQKNP